VSIEAKCELFVCGTEVVAWQLTSTACCWAGIWKTSRPVTEPRFENWTRNYSKL